MSRDFFTSGECLVLVKGRSDSAIGGLTQLGLSQDPIQVRATFRHDDLIVDAQGSDVPVDVQGKLLEAQVTMNLIHVDPAVLEVCIAESTCGAGGFIDGTTSRAGQRMGNNQPRFGPGGVNGNHYIGLNLTAPQTGNPGLPWRFWYSYLTGPGITWPLGTEKSVIQLSWRCIPYTQDPYGGSPAQPNSVFGTGAQGNIVWDHVLDT